MAHSIFNLLLSYLLVATMLKAFAAAWLHSSETLKIFLKRLFLHIARMFLSLHQKLQSPHCDTYELVPKPSIATHTDTTNQNDRTPMSQRECCRCNITGVDQTQTTEERIETASEHIKETAGSVCLGQTETNPSLMLTQVVRDEDHPTTCGRKRQTCNGAGNASSRTRVAISATVRATLTLPEFSNASEKGIIAEGTTYEKPHTFDLELPSLNSAEMLAHIMASCLEESTTHDVGCFKDCDFKSIQCKIETGLFTIEIIPADSLDSQ